MHRIYKGSIIREDGLALVSAVEVAYANNSCLHTSCNFPSIIVCTCVAVIGHFSAVPCSIYNAIISNDIHYITIHEYVCNKWLVITE